MKPELQADHPHPAPAHCPNCGSAISGNYCAHCGQETVLHRPSALEFLHEFVGHYVALEGKLTGTLGRLLFRPGALTVEYLAGRRVRFVQPLRLYLTLSLLFFALMKLSGASLQDNDIEPTAAHQAAPAAHQPAVHQPTPPAAPTVEPPSAASAPAQPVPAKPDAAAQEADDDQGLEIGVGKMAWLTRVWPSAASALEHFNGLSGKEKNRIINEGFYHLAPTAMFCLMPLFALYLKVLYLGHGHRYGEHLLFALHSNAFAFAIFICMRVCNIGLVSFVLWIWLIGYLPWAMRRVYGLRRFATAWRWLLLMFVYLLSMGLALMMTVTAGVLTAGH